MGLNYRPALQYIETVLYSLLSFGCTHTDICTCQVDIFGIACFLFGS